LAVFLEGCKEKGIEPRRHFHTGGFKSEVQHLAHPVMRYADSVFHLSA
jgi:predicted HicB family RNase H-like nuclease